MAETKIADVIQPELFAQYVIDETTEKSEIMFNGVIENDTRLNKLVEGGGTILTMPQWNDLTGKSQVLKDDEALTVNNITSKATLATLLIRGNAWGSNELAGALAGDDPMRAIASRVADWWVRDEKANILSTLKGVFSAVSMADLVEDKSTAKISSTMVLDAKQRMGDASDMLTMIYMHSAVFTELQKQNMIQFIPASDSKIDIPTYLGYRVIMDDSAPKESDVYTTYLLSRGCIKRGVGVPTSLTSVETDRDSLASVDLLINRQAKVFHPRGISWVGSGRIADSTPTDEELATGTNWELKADKKKVGIVALKHKIVD